ncbi:hypothetical protein J437_LFUL010941 [Ladona fulva]|uniref:PiggyBac transposable element-derived protein domain-containing protein n=1 Tax=Ladona fulva TaxID=123851 RepID=A0A8K0P4W4_LADFU|nr:hypothetical protein J437_LFUL010941 [Ladona fulva]
MVWERRLTKSKYLPKENIAVDISLALWKGRLSFRQYIPLKSSKCGIEIFKLCESEYLWSFTVYSGADSKISVTTIPDGLKTSALFQQKDGKFKPVCNLEYNKAMGGVDLKDEKLQPYLLEHKKCNKWYIKFV